MKLCALILAHQKLALLSRLARRLQQAGIGAFVHVDAKLELAPFIEACAGTGAIFVRDRADVFWGGYSMIEATLALARQAIGESAASHFLCISGDTYPIQPDDRVHSFLLRDCDFIDTEEFPPGSATFQRIAGTYLPDTPIGALRATIDQEARHLDPAYFAQAAAAARVYALKSATAFPLRYAKGANWWCLRRKTLESCIARIEDSEITEWFRFSANPDESLFNTLVLNFFSADEVLPCPVYAIWNRAERPYEFRELSDLPLLKECDLPFARKFAATAGPLLDAVESGSDARSRGALRAARRRFSLPSLFNLK